MTVLRLVAALLAFLALVPAVRSQAEQAATANETARFLAGLPLSANSPLAPLVQDPAFKQHAQHFDAAFGNLDAIRLAKIRAWSAANLTAPRSVLFYHFAGPDFLYADAFFPRAETYVLSGLEPVGQIPELMKMPRWAVMQALRNIQFSLRSVLTVSYFITVDMSRDLNSGPLPGTIPILYVFLARTGKDIHDVSLVYLDEQGVLHSGDGTRPWRPARGVKIVFSEPGGPRKTLYYFSANLADAGSRPVPLLQFCKSLPPGDGFVKSASYLLHTPGFSQVRNFLLDHIVTLVQDDTGVPLHYFDPARWRLVPFGRYMTPIFPAYFQPRLHEFYQRAEPAPLDFGVGYRWRPNESNLLVAVKTVKDTEPTSSYVAPPPPPAAYRPPPQVAADTVPFAAPSGPSPAVPPPVPLLFLPLQPAPPGTPWPPMPPGGPNVR
ncbi:MAG TPA: hypothetical protein VNK48_09150 [Xanthobacteraceae bacterium]|nr:hypothetical protein [Xanthobacteraceae bacterium]